MVTSYAIHLPSPRSFSFAHRGDNRERRKKMSKQTSVGVLGALFLFFFYFEWNFFVWQSPPHFVARRPLGSNEIFLFFFAFCSDPISSLHLIGIFIETKTWIRQEISHFIVNSSRRTNSRCWTLSSGDHGWPAQAQLQLAAVAARDWRESSPAESQVELRFALHSRQNTSKRSFNWMRKASEWREEEKTFVMSEISYQSSSCVIIVRSITFHGNT